MFLKIMRYLIVNNKKKALMVSSVCTGTGPPTSDIEVAWCRVAFIPTKYTKVVCWHAIAIN